MSRDTALTGAAGEHYVAFRLAASGYAVGITTRGQEMLTWSLLTPIPENL